MMLRIGFVCLLLAGIVVAQDLPVMPYDSLMEDRVSVDGYVEREDGEFEYPAYLKNPATGLTVSWGFDDEFIYVAVETRGKGWFGIGFGTPEMNESNMVVGYYTDDSSDVFCVVGKGHTHELAGSADSLLPDWDLDFDDETGVTALEFTYPLTWRGEGAPEPFASNEVLKKTAVSGLEPGDIYDLILARNAKSTSLTTRHTHRSSAKFQLAQNPKQNDEEEGQ
jgi:hypothetical protein